MSEQQTRPRPSTEAGRRLARHIFTATESHCEADILAIETEARDAALREQTRITVERIRSMLEERGWREDSDDEYRGVPIKFGWGALESDLDQVLDEVAALPRTPGEDPR